MMAHAHSKLAKEYSFFNYRHVFCCRGTHLLSQGVNTTGNGQDEIELFALSMYEDEVKNLSHESKSAAIAASSYVLEVERKGYHHYRYFVPSIDNPWGRGNCEYVEMHVKDFMGPNANPYGMKNAEIFMDWYCKDHRGATGYADKTIAIYPATSVMFNCRVARHVSENWEKGGPNHVGGEEWQPHKEPIKGEVLKDGTDMVTHDTAIEAVIKLMERKMELKVMKMDVEKDFKHGGDKEMRKEVKDKVQKEVGEEEHLRKEWAKIERELEKEARMNVANKFEEEAVEESAKEVVEAFDDTPHCDPTEFSGEIIHEI